MRGRSEKAKRRRREFKAAINLMEKSNTKQIHSSKLDASLVLFWAPRAKPQNKLSLLIDRI